MKYPDLVKELEGRAAEALKALIRQVPVIEPEGIKVEVEPEGAHHGIDFLVRINVAGRPRVLVCEVKSSGQPRHVRAALPQLLNYVAHFDGEAFPVFIAPYLSSEAKALCREHGVGFIDFEGNARLIFDNVFIERVASSKPPAEQRELKSLFKPKSAQVLRVMLSDPHRAWRVIELADVAGVSLGHVSNVRNGLLEREWAQVSEQGLFLSKPDVLLNAWRDDYEPPAGKRMDFYTTLSGSTFEEAIRHVLHSGPDGARAILASFSAAHWLAPYGRTGTQYFYADNAGLEQLKIYLKLSHASKGENVVITILKEDGLFHDGIEPAPRVICTSLVQTYLDLAVAGERGREAAEHLRQERLRWAI
jgi:Transcriptional regulator, AbiEi antitoxin, Type IV TA system